MLAIQEREVGDRGHAVADDSYQQDYERALGAFLVRYNTVEALLGQLLEGALRNLEVHRLYKPDEYFSQKIDRFELALCALLDWPKPDWERLRQINVWRNEVAHGNFHADPFTGEYLTRALHKKGKKGQARAITPDAILKYAATTSEAEAELGKMLPFMWFQRLPGDNSLPQGARTQSR
jgi:hypothetical protein